MPEAFALLAGLVVVAHLAFVAFAVLGGLLALRWLAIAWVHVPAAVWAAYVELSGRLCPLTPLENSLRVKAGLDDYSGDFVSRYLFPILYPDGLTRDAQVVIGIVVIALNTAAYSWVVARRAKKKPASFDE